MFLDAMMRKDDVRTIRSKTCKTIAAAPLNPPPSAFFRAFFKSNYNLMVR
jgi:hypothetical protein